MTFKTTILISTLCFLASCAFHSGNITSGTISKPVVYKDVSIGISNTLKVFGLGGLSKEALVFEAKKQMMFNRKLAEGERYGDISIDFKRTFILFVQKTQVTVIADIIADKDSLSQESYSLIYKNKMFAGKTPTVYLTDDERQIIGVESNFPNSATSTDENSEADEFRSELFVNGERVYYSYPYDKTGTFLRSIDIDKCEVELDSKKIKKIALNKVFIVRDSWRDIKIGDQWGRGKVIAFGHEGLLYKRGNMVYFSEYPK